MKIGKQQVVELLRQQGDEGTARQAESNLPDEVDTDRDAGLLREYGINIDDLTGGGAGLEDGTDRGGAFDDLTGGRDDDRG